MQVASIQILHARAIRGSAIELPAADLVIVDGPHSGKDVSEDSRPLFAELLGIARARGYKPGWAAHQYKDKFGACPGWDSPPMQAAPSPVRSRQIAFAKGQR